MGTHKSLLQRTDVWPSPHRLYDSLDTHSVCMDGRAGADPWYRRQPAESFGQAFGFEKMVASPGYGWRIDPANRSDLSVRQKQISPNRTVTLPESFASDAERVGLYAHKQYIPLPGALSNCYHPSGRDQIGRLRLDHYYGINRDRRGGKKRVV